MMVHFKGDEMTEMFLVRCPTTHAHLEVSMNNNDMYRTVTGSPQKTATCLTDHNSINAQSTKFLRDSSFQSLLTNLALGSNNLKFSYQVDLQHMRSITRSVGNLKEVFPSSWTRGIRKKQVVKY